MSNYLTTVPSLQGFLARWPNSRSLRVRFSSFSEIFYLSFGIWHLIFPLKPPTSIPLTLTSTLAFHLSPFPLLISHLTFELWHLAFLIGHLSFGFWTLTFGNSPSASTLELHLRRSSEHHLLTAYCLLPTAYYIVPASTLTLALTFFLLTAAPQHHIIFRFREPG